MGTYIGFIQNKKARKSDKVRPNFNKVGPCSFHTIFQYQKDKWV